MSATAPDAFSRPRVTPVGALARGVAAGLIGTMAMDLWLYGQYRRQHGTEPFREWEFSADVTDWDKAPAPAQVGRRIVEGLYEVKLPDSRAALANNVMHWGYSVSAAVGYAMVAASLRKPRTSYGLIFGAGMWGLSYAILTPMHLYKRITEYDAKTLGKDLVAHLVYGMGTAAALSLLLSRGRDRR
ncbi:DUF1440 domain-containing protein [Diaminobutyricibacter tongyongensis]|uniref:DUF1440 domain-containing protein n=1 Tax=Leifsonia tongyongensis TaxID=1268043 RepID=A0A6L9XWK4_9MICO|nr:DUF1440 domain-containing protein [Diaminobutyricibacter tongyongensis]NEN05820.1 DUF1440 domain-containing protein [Diaminobutyricibacter tongyongensis]